MKASIEILHPYTGKVEYKIIGWSKTSTVQCVCINENTIFDQWMDGSIKMKSINHFHNLIENLRQQLKCTFIQQWFTHCLIKRFYGLEFTASEPIVVCLCVHCAFRCNWVWYQLIVFFVFHSPDCQPPPPPPPPPKKPADAIATHARAHTNTCNKNPKQHNSISVAPITHNTIKNTRF